MIKSVLTGMAGLSLALGGVAHAAETQAPMVRDASPVEASESEELAGTSILYVIGAVVVGLAILEITEAIDIFEGDDEPYSP